MAKFVHLTPETVVVSNTSADGIAMDIDLNSDACSCPVYSFGGQIITWEIIFCGVWRPAWLIDILVHNTKS